MNIYRRNLYGKVHRDIYKKFHGEIPCDITGRTYDVHHIDGNHENNDICNLIALSIQDHYNIHYKQEDYGACYFIALRMKLSTDDLSNISMLAQTARVDQGIHHFLGELNPAKQQIRDGTHRWLTPEHAATCSDRAKQQVVDGTHNFLGGSISGSASRERVTNGTHNFLGDKNPNTLRLSNRTHNFLNSDFQRDNALARVQNGTHHFLGGELAIRTVRKRVLDGTHHFCGDTHPNKQQVTCPHCSKTGGAVNMRRYHFDNCKGLR